MPIASSVASPPCFTHPFAASVRQGPALAPRVAQAAQARRTMPMAPVTAVGWDGMTAAATANPTLWRTLGTQVHRLAGPGTLVGQHPFLSVSGGLLGSVAALALANDVYGKLQPEQKARVRAALQQLGRSLEKVAPYAGSFLLGSVSGILGQEGGVRWGEARHLSATLMLLASVPSGLAALETIGAELEIPVLRKAWSGPARFCNTHQADVGGALLGAAGISSASFASRLLAANNPWGWMLMAGALPAVLGGAELIGREHDIRALKQCLTRPVKWTIDKVRTVVSQDVAVQGVGAALAVAGLWGVGAGWYHLGMGESGLGDALGAAQVTAGTLASGLGAGFLTERRKWIPSAKRVLTDYNDAMASSALSAWGAALAKFAAFNMMTFGPAYLNTAAAALSFGAVGVGGIAAFRQIRRKRDAQGALAVAPELDARLSKRVDRVWALSGGIGSGTWAALILRGLLQGAQSSALLTALNAIPQVGAAAALGAVSIGMMGWATDNAAMGRIANDVADNVQSGAMRSLDFAVEHPASTLTVLGLLLLLAKHAL